MAGLKGRANMEHKIVGGVSSFSWVPPVGTRMTPFSAEFLPAQYKKSILEKNPSFEDADLVEAYLGYGPVDTPNYRLWNRMMEVDLKSFK
jgi:hypothetical protein